MFTLDDIRQVIREELSAISNTCDRKEAARILRCSTDTIARMEKRGDLVNVNPGGRPRYSKRQVYNV